MNISFVSISIACIFCGSKHKRDRLEGRNDYIVKMEPQSPIGEGLMHFHVQHKG